VLKERGALGAADRNLDLAEELNIVCAVLKGGLEWMVMKQPPTCSFPFSPSTFQLQNERSTY